MMEREKIIKELQGIFREVFIDDTLSIQNETAAKDIEGWDSLMQITLISEIEKRYNLMFSIEDVKDLQNVGEMVEIIIKKLENV